MEDVEHLKGQLASTPWCKSLLDNKNLVVEIPVGRQVKRGGDDAAFAYTFKTKHTIPIYLVFYQPPEKSGEPVNEVLGILQLRGGLNGFPNTCHGGIVATILDEIMGELINVNLKHRAIMRTSYMTAYINTTYVKPVRTPSTILARGRISKIDGRKLLATAAIEDGEGTVLAKAEALFIGLNRKL